MELDLHTLFGLQVHSCTHWLRPRNIPPHLRQHLGSYTRALLVSQDRRHLFVTPWREWRNHVSGLRSNPTKTSHWSPSSSMGIGDIKCLTRRWCTVLPVDRKMASRYTRTRIFFASILNFVLFHCKLCRNNMILGKKLFDWTFIWGATIIPRSLDSA
jgi:hypothetical protein